MPTTRRFPFVPFEISKGTDRRATITLDPPARRRSRAVTEGQLYIDLHGFAPGKWPLDPAETLSRFLTQLGVAHTDRPAAANIIKLSVRLPPALRVVAANLAFDKQRSLQDAATKLAAAD